MVKIHLNNMSFKYLVCSLTLIYSLVYPSTNAADSKLITTIGKASSFSSIQNLVTDSLGASYVLDQTPQSTVLHKIDDTGKLIANFSLGASQPLDIALSNDGYLYTIELIYLPDSYKNIVKKWTPSGQLMLRWEITANNYVQAVMVKLAMTNDNKLLVALQNKISVFSAQGELLKEIKGYVKPNNLNQIQFFAMINRLAINETNQLLILDSNKKLIAIDLDGKLLKPVISNDKNQIGSYSNLAFDTQGNIYDSQPIIRVNDSFNSCHCIRQFDSTGKLVKTLGSLGSKKGQFYNPLAFRLDKKNNLYVADSGNNRVQKLNKEGKVLWSKGDQIGELSLAKGVVADSKNNIYVLDAGHYRIQKFAANSTVLKSWGA
ncbi:MAG: NHL repeat-containing protein [Thiolinea sp.]